MVDGSGVSMMNPDDDDGGPGGGDDLSLCYVMAVRRQEVERK
jgi:hypothetical protein